MATDLIPVIADEDREPDLLGHDSPPFPDLVPGWDDQADEYEWQVGQ